MPRCTTVKETGLGQYVDISLVKTLASMAVKLDDQRIYHRETKKTGSQGSNLLCPYGTFRCPDGKYIIIACSNNSLTFRFFRLIGRPELCEDPRFASNMKRLENTEILMPVLYEWLEKMGTAANAEKRCCLPGCPAPEYTPMKMWTRTPITMRPAGLPTSPCPKEWP